MTKDHLATKIPTVYSTCDVPVPIYPIRLVDARAQSLFSLIILAVRAASKVLFARYSGHFGSNGF